MQTNVIMSKLSSMLSWVTKLAYLNGLWLLFSLAGFVFIGFFPATVTMMAICRKWLNGEEDIPLFRTFSQGFKTELVKANLLGWFFTAIGIVLYLNFLVLQANMNSVNIVFISAFYLFVFLFILALTHVIPMYVHYHMSLLTCIKNAFIVGLVNMHISLAIIVSQSAIYYLLFSYPAGALFFLGSVLSMIQMWLALRSFKKIDNKMNNTNQFEQATI
ncbi:YesL family protein [Halalkalibacter urbisdiaboli]|uniref:YesL family protein n=1 Tax=Halalkalibacter urbisdiaboli TaxID=1960589 RepID=UPI000B44AEC6|nr:YesL family protein [Halalkalibacter urbisdiaboli]